jgi:AcrR family transcriptional regulator
MRQNSVTDDSGRDPQVPTGWQAQKSATTRSLIVEAAVRCFVEIGYARTTTTAIANKAGLSRGAMLHHFPSKMAIVRAAVMHLHAKRLRAFRKAVDRTSAQGDRLRTNLQAYWAHVRHPMFVAFFELAVAARTDSKLAAILRPAQEALEEELHRTAREAFTEWRTSDANFDMALDLTRYVLEGMAISFLVHKENEGDRRVRAYLEEKLRELRNGRG